MMDANFRLKLKDRGIVDKVIAPGWAYFVREDAYLDVVKNARVEDEVRSL